MSFVRRFAAIGILLLASVAGAQTVDSGEVFSLSARDASFLDDLQRRAVRYFVEQRDPTTGLILDRASVDGGIGYAPSSVAATGFGLTA